MLRKSTVWIAKLHLRNSVKSYRWTCFFERFLFALVCFVYSLLQFIVYSVSPEQAIYLASKKTIDEVYLASCFFQGHVRLGKASECLTAFCYGWDTELFIACPTHHPGYDILLLVYKTTWMQTIRQDLNSIGIKLNFSKASKTLNRLLELTHDRKTWRSFVKWVVQY